MHSTYSLPAKTSRSKFPVTYKQVLTAIIFAMLVVFSLIGIRQANINIARSSFSIGCMDGPTSAQQCRDMARVYAEGINKCSIFGMPGEACRMQSERLVMQKSN